MPGDPGAARGEESPSCPAPARVSAPSGAATILSEGSRVRGYQPVFQDLWGLEARYQASREQQAVYLREVPLADSRALGLLRWEQGLLERLTHPLLPRLVEAFEADGYFYLVTEAARGVRLDRKQAASEQVAMKRGRELYDLLVALSHEKVHLDLSPENVLEEPSGSLRLLDLRRSQRSPGHPLFRAGQAGPSLGDDLAGLGRCLYYWLTGGSVEFARPLSGVSEAGVELVRQLLSGRYQNGREGFLSEPSGPSLLPTPVLNASGPLRIPIRTGSTQHCLPPGSRLASYEVEFYARGGMSLCYLGRLGNDVRFLKEVKADDPETADALRREFEFLRVLKHPHIVRAHQIFEHNGYLYVVMDYIEGSSLEALMAGPEQPPLSERCLLEWALQLTEALHFLHTQSPPIVYRDLKPGNVVLAQKNHLYLIDFGLARTFKEGQESDTQALGTFATASPEHFTGQTTPRSDVYSLGATLYLLARPGYKAAIPFQFPPLRKFRPDLSAGLEALLKRCLEPVPEARWQSAQALGEELRKLLADCASEVVDDLEGLTPADFEELRYLPGLEAHAAALTRQVVEVLGQGKSAGHAFAAVGEQCEIEAVNRLFRLVARRLLSGEPLAQVLSDFPVFFPAAYAELVARGERERTLAARLSEAADLLEKEDLARRTRGAPESEAEPLDATPSRLRERRRRRLQVAGVGAAALVVGGLAAAALLGSGLTHGQLAAAGGSAALGTGLLATGVAAFRDARRLRAWSRPQNLVEDAWTSYALGDADKAEKELGDALVLARDRLGVTHLTTLTSLHSLANLCRQRKRYTQANDYYQQALRIYQEVLSPEHPARGHLHFHWGQCLLALKDVPAALSQLEQSLAIWERYAQKHPLELAEVQFFKGQVHFEQGEDRPAVDLFSRSLEVQYAELGLRSPLVHTTMSYLTRAYVRLGHFQKSEPYLLDLLRAMERDAEPNYPALAEANLDMGLVRLEEGKGAQAEPYFLRALQLLQHYVGPNQRLLKRVLDGYQRIYGNVAEREASIVHLTSLFLGEREKIRRSLEQHPEWLNSRDNTGWGPVQWATFVGRDDVVRFLLERGADPGYDATHVMGPLHVACAWDRADCLFLLLEKDPDVNATGPGGWQPVFWCAQSGHPRLMEILLRRGADVKGRDLQGRTALHIAAARNHLSMVAALLSAGADVNAQESFLGSTPLHLAAERGHLAVCDCLIYNGARLAQPDKARRTALDLATRNHHKLLARILRKHQKEGFARQPR